LATTFDRELLAAHAAIKLFRHFCEGRAFQLWTDHTPLVTAISRVSASISPRQQRHLAFNSEFNVQILYLPGLKNVVADFLSCPNQITAGSVTAGSAADPVDFEEMAAELNRCPETQRLLGSTSLKLAFRKTGAQRLARDVSTGNFRPCSPQIGLEYWQIGLEYLQLSLEYWQLGLEYWQLGLEYWQLRLGILATRLGILAISAWNIGNSAWNIGNSAWNIGNSAWNIGNSAWNIGNSAWNIGNPAWNIGNSAWNIGNSAWNIGNSAWNIGNSAWNIGNSAWNIGNLETIAMAYGGELDS
jgi:hypothetical protein